MEQLFVLLFTGHDGIVAVKRQFIINSGQTTNLTLDMDANHSVIKIDENYYLKPVVVRFLSNQ